MAGGPAYGGLARRFAELRIREHLNFWMGEWREGMAPRRILLVRGKAEASFAHSKRFAQYDGAVPVGASRCEGATEPRGSVWSARSLLPLWLVPTPACALESAGVESWKAVFVSGSTAMRRAEAPSARSKIEMLPIAFSPGKQHCCCAQPKLPSDNKSKVIRNFLMFQPLFVKA